MAESNPAHFVRLLVQHQNALLRYILPLVACLDDAQDVLQETAVALWQKFDQYDTSCPFLPWAKRFAHHEILMHHRRRRRYTFLTEEMIELLSNPPTESEFYGEQMQTALHDCIKKLSDADRLLLDRRYAEPGTTIQQLAPQVGQTANVLYKALARIRRQLLHCVNQAQSIPSAT